MPAQDFKPLKRPADLALDAAPKPDNNGLPLDFSRIADSFGCMPSSIRNEISRAANVG